MNNTPILRAKDLVGTPHFIPHGIIKEPGATYGTTTPEHLTQTVDYFRGKIKRVKKTMKTYTPQEMTYVIEYIDGYGHGYLRAYIKALETLKETAPQGWTIENVIDTILRAKGNNL